MERLTTEMIVFINFPVSQCCLFGRKSRFITENLFFHYLKPVFTSGNLSTLSYSNSRKEKFYNSEYRGPKSITSGCMLFKFGLADSPLCYFYNKKLETLEHFFFLL